jgi:hypothetical protein
LRDDSETQVLFQAETAGHGEHPSEPQPHPEPPEENTGDLGVAP